VQRDVGVMQELVGAGMLTCITARSLTERADRRARSVAWELVGAGLAHVIASDAHETSRRPPDLGPALERAGLDGDQIDYFTRVAPAAVITGVPLAQPPLVDDGHGRRWSGRRRR
jgi:protein-tyrosine phosphatase